MSVSNPTSPCRAYDPLAYGRLSFAEARAAFIEGRDTPRAFLERCLEAIDADEPNIRAFVCFNLPGARDAADRSTARYRAGRPLSLVDGLPLGIKDVFETKDMPTEMNSPAYAGWQPERDAASVDALRRGGAIILGKTVTTEFAQGLPGPTRNPFDFSRTPGGSSSGSAAAVGGGLVPVAVGSQARGSIIRPASYCANYALKPTFGALNALGMQGMGAPSQCTVGIHAATLEDCWTAAFHVSANAGGDPGHPGLYGEQTLGSPRRIERLIRLDTLGWDYVEPGTRDTFERFIRQVEALGVTVIGRQDNARIDDLECMLRTVPDVMWPILLWEMRWPGRLARARGGDNAISKMVLERLEKADQMDIQEYRQALTRRDALYTSFAAVAEMADACVTLCTVGPAPSGMDVGNPAFADISSNLLSPALSLPLLAVSGLPLGIQLLGRRHQDFALTQHAHWLSHAYISSQPTGTGINRLTS